MKKPAKKVNKVKTDTGTVKPGRKQSQEKETDETSASSKKKKNNN